MLLFCKHLAKQMCKQMYTFTQQQNNFISRIYKDIAKILIDLKSRSHSEHLINETQEKDSFHDLVGWMV